MVCAVTVADPRPEPMCENVEPYCTCVPMYLREVTSQLDLDTTTSREFAESALTVYEAVEVVKVTASAIAAKRATGSTEENFILSKSEKNDVGQGRSRLLRRDHVFYIYHTGVRSLTTPICRQFQTQFL